MDNTTFLSLSISLSSTSSSTAPFQIVAFLARHPNEHFLTSWSGTCHTKAFYSTWKNNEKSRGWARWRWTLWMWKQCMRGSNSSTFKKANNYGGRMKNNSFCSVRRIIYPDCSYLLYSFSKSSSLQNGTTVRVLPYRTVPYPNLEPHLTPFTHITLQRNDNREVGRQEIWARIRAWPFKKKE